jgi:hypothetical protein
MKTIGDIKLIIEAVCRDRECFAARCNFTERCTAENAETTIVFVGHFWLVSDHRVSARN